MLYLVHLLKRLKPWRIAYGLHERNGKMKIVLLNTSARKNGATSRILTGFSETLSAKPGVETTFMHLSDLRIGFCSGCCLCYKNGVCHIGDDADMLSELLDNADGVIIGTPNYVGNVSGQLKTFIDRGHFVMEQLMKDKYTVGVVTYENTLGGAALKVLRNLFVFSGAKGYSGLVVKTPFGSDPLASQKVKAKVTRMAEKFYKSIRDKKAGPPINRILQSFAFNIVIKPFVLRKGDQFDGVLKHWSKRGINYERR